MCVIGMSLNMRLALGQREEEDINIVSYLKVYEKGAPPCSVSFLETPFVSQWKLLRGKVCLMKDILIYGFVDNTGCPAADHCPLI